MRVLHWLRLSTTKDALLPIHIVVPYVVEYVMKFKLVRYLFIVHLTTMLLH